MNASEKGSGWNACAAVPLYAVSVSALELATVVSMMGRPSETL